MKRSRPIFLVAIFFVIIIFLTLSIPPTNLPSVVAGPSAELDNLVYLPILLRPACPADHPLIDFGQATTGNIFTATARNTYSFCGNSGDIVRFDISRTSGSLTPQLEIFTPSGALICDEFTNSSAISMACALDASGTYTLLVGDWGLNGTGGYALYSQKLTYPVGAERINFDDVQTSAITSIVQHDTYTFDVTAGDMIRLDISRTSGSITPQVDIYRPDGTRLCDSFTNSSSLSLDCTIDTGGKHTVLIGDWGLNATGGYAFYIQRLNNPTGAAAINFGDVQTGAITSIVQHDTYTFDVTAGDIIHLDISRTSGSITPQINIYRPDGTQLCDDFTNSSGLTLDCTVDTSGTHTILAGDWGLNATGGYALYMQRLNNPTGAAPVNFGDVRTSAITSIVQRNTYTFDVTAGDIIRLDISRTSGTFTPQVDIYRPDGTRLCDDFTNSSGLTLDCTVDTSGTHTLLAGDWGLNATGGYAFTIQRLNNPSGAVPVNFGDVQTSAIASIVQHNSYTFDVTAGDIIRLDISRTSGTFTPQVDIYRPDGTRLCDDFTNSSGLTLDCTVDTSGIHTLLVGDWGLNATGGYAFYMQRLNNPSGAAAINFGDTKVGSITSIVQHISYTFTATTGDDIRFDMSRTSGSITPKVDVYRPDGTSLCNSFTNSSALTLDCTVDTSGTHSVLVGDWGLNGTGGYTLALAKLN